MAKRPRRPTPRRPARRRGGPLRLTVTLSPPLADVLDGVAALCGQSRSQAAASLVAASLAEARHDPAVQAAVSSRHGRARLYAVGESRP